jgi:hypothetical protein
MFEKAKETFASLFNQLAAAQKQIDGSARRIVEGVVLMIDVVDDEAPSSREALPGHDFTWHEGVAHTLATERFGAAVGFEPREWLSRPVESRALAEYAIGDRGTVVASWFATPPTPTRPAHPVVSMFTACEDGATFTTVAGGTASHLPMLATEHDELLSRGTAVLEVLARHRARVASHASPARQFESVDAYLTARRARKQERAAFRRAQGLGLVERYITGLFTEDKADVGQAYLDAIRKHPEWYKYAAGTTGAAISPAPAKTAAPPSMPINYMMSADDNGRRTLTTFGMLFAGLPELLMTDVAANHSRAARVLMGTTARAIARLRTAAPNDAQFVAAITAQSAVHITLTAADATAAGVNQVGGAAHPRPVDVQLTMRGFTGEDEATLLGVIPFPDDDRRSLDDRLRDACAQLGVDVPAARGAESADDAMRAAHEQARNRLGVVNARWRAREASGEKVLVKMRATKGDVGEFVWLEVRDWRDGSLDADVVTPAPRVGLAMGQSLTIDESQVYDQLVRGPSGFTVVALTDVVATDYGMDI